MYIIIITHPFSDSIPDVRGREHQLLILLRVTRLWIIKLFTDIYTNKLFRQWSRRKKNLFRMLENWISCFWIFLYFIFHHECCLCQIQTLRRLNFWLKNIVPVTVRQNSGLPIISHEDRENDLTKILLEACHRCFVEFSPLEAEIADDNSRIKKRRLILGILDFGTCTITYPESLGRVGG